MMKRVICILLLLTAISGCFTAVAEDKRVFILCNPESWVNVRRSPKMSASESGRLECGDSVITDGRKKNGFIHVTGITEDGEGWVYRGYIVEDEPIIETVHATVAATGRVKAQRYIGGKRTEWLKVCTDLKVYARSEQWAVTNRGFVKMKYLEVWE